MSATIQETLAPLDPHWDRIVRTPMSRKIWSAIRLGTLSFERLLQILASLANVKPVEPDWINPTTSPAGVTSTERHIEFDGEILRIRRLEYECWEAPMISFNMREPILTGPDRSRIRMLDRRFKEAVAGYKLVNYGPLDSAAIPPE